jgi:RNA polymerase sigma-70 factor (ECF subfamily)
MSGEMRNIADMEDKLLVWRCKQGNAAALRRIYEKYRDNLLIIAFSILYEPSEAEDVVQDVFVKFVQRLDGFELRQNLKGFLGVCTANCARDRNRLARKNVGIDEIAELADDNANVLNDMILSDDTLRLRSALKKLSEEQRQIVILHTRADMSLSRIAKELGLPVNTVKSRYRYAMGKLRTWLCEVEK